MAVGLSATLAGQDAPPTAVARPAGGGLVVQVASHGIERVRIAHPLHGWSTTVAVVPGRPIRLEGLFPGDYVVEGWVTGIIAGRSVTVTAGAPAIIELKECWIAPDLPEEGGERVSRRYSSEPRRDRSVRPRAAQAEREPDGGVPRSGASGGGSSAASGLGSDARALVDWMLSNCSACVLLSAFDAATGAPIPVLELRDEGRLELFGSNAIEVQAPVALPATSFDPAEWAWRPYSVWWVRAPGFSWQRVIIDHSAGGSIAIGLVRARETTPPQ